MTYSDPEGSPSHGTAEPGRYREPDYPHKVIPEKY